MMTITIEQLTIICVIGAIVVSVFLFPSFWDKAKSLIGGFLENFITDTAKTPEGARAIYAQKIEEVQNDYNDAVYTLQDLAGQLKTIKDQFEDSQARAQDFDAKTRAAVNKGDDKTARTFAVNYQEELVTMNALSQQYEEMRKAVEEAKKIKELLENKLVELKKESKRVVSEMITNEQVANAYSSIDKLKASTGTDKMLNAARDGAQSSRERAAGAKVIYQSSREGKLNEATARASDYQVDAYLESLKKGSSKPITYDIKDINVFTHSSGQVQTQSKK